jgi:osmotically inducible protein OsmC
MLAVFLLKLSFVLGAAGHEPSSIETTCAITLDNGAITNSHLTVKATVPGIDAAKFQECAEMLK